MIDKVRQTVMYVLNKDNNGYITPDEFNKYADMAQNEIFQEYFGRYNDYKNKMKLGRVNSGYADIVKQMEQAIDYFTSNTICAKAFSPAKFAVTVHPTTGAILNVDILSPGAGYDPTLIASPLVIISSTPPTTAATILYSTDALGNVINTVIVSPGSGYPNVVTAMADNTGNTGQSYDLPADWFLLNAVYLNGKEVQPVSQQKLYYLLNSNLTAPTETYPSYVMHGNSIELYPSSIQDNLELFYIRYPKIPNWTYTLISNGQPVFDFSSTLYQDFEVAETEYVKLVLKILQYCGVQIREQEVVTYAAQQEQITHQTEKQ